MTARPPAAEGSNRRGARPDRTPAASPAGATLTDTVWALIRQDVLDGHLSPGQRLTLESLKTTYAAGVSPLREALWRLSQEGLVKASSHRGFQVSDVGPDELIDITRLRVTFEQMALEEAITEGGDAWEADMLSTFHRLSKLRPADGTEWDHWHDKFHDALVATCRSPMLRQLRSQLHDLSFRYRSVVAGKFPNIAAQIFVRDDLPEHRSLMTACLDRDVAVAKRLIAEHFQFTAQRLIASLDRRPTSEPAVG
jgi:GntR family carbon starvation induced transcriptional regulator